MKIAYITSQVYKHGGIEKVLSQKANWFAEIHNDEVWIVTTRQRNKNPVYKFSEKINFIDIGIDYEISKSYFSLKNSLKIPFHYKRLRNALHRIKPDVIICCNFEPDFYFLPFLAPGIPKIKEYHSSRAIEFRKRGNTKSVIVKLTEHMESKYDSIVVLNKDEVQYYNNRNIVVIPNPAEPSQYRGNIEAQKIIAAGRISPVKDFSELIDAWALIRKDLPGWEIHIYGEDYLGTEAKLCEQIKTQQLGNSVFFKGVTSDLKNTMQQYSIYAMTSETECFPMVLLEALSCGLPVVSYDCPTGPANILTNQSDSILVENRNRKAYAAALKKLCIDKNLRLALSENAVDNVKRFYPSEVFRLWKDLFLNLRPE